jgi:hypothetical protein
VYGPEITTRRYKGLLQEYVKLCYGFPHKVAPLVVLRFPTQSGPFGTMLFRQFTKNVTKTGRTDRSHPHSTEHDTQPIAYIISKQTVPYRTHGGTYCPRGSTPKIRSLANSSMTSHVTWRNPTVSTIPTLLEHSIDPHYGHITSRQMGNHLSQRHKPNSTSERMERLVQHSWLMAKHN